MVMSLLSSIICSDSSFSAKWNIGSSSIPKTLYLLSIYLFSFLLSQILCCSHSGWLIIPWDLSYASLPEPVSTPGPAFSASIFPFHLLSEPTLLSVFQVLIQMLLSSWSVPWFFHQKYSLLLGFNGSNTFFFFFPALYFWA